MSDLSSRSPFVTLYWDLQLAIARVGQRYYFIITRPSLQDTHLYYPLNVVYGKNNFGNPTRTFWLNSSMGNGSAEHGAGGFTPLHIIRWAVPADFMRVTGRTRREVSAQEADMGVEIECPEVELLIPEEDIYRQCYFCLKWEQHHDVSRHHQLKGDLYWCSCCRAKGKLRMKMHPKVFLRHRFRDIFPRGVYW